MIPLKNKHAGFTLIEVLLAMAIVGIVLVPIYALQGQMMARIVKMASEVHRMFVAYDFFLVAVPSERGAGQKNYRNVKGSCYAYDL